MVGTSNLGSFFMAIDYCYGGDFSPVIIEKSPWQKSQGLDPLAAGPSPGSHEPFEKLGL